MVTRSEKLKQAKMKADLMDRVRVLNIDLDKMDARKTFSELILKDHLGSYTCWLRANELTPEHREELYRLILDFLKNKTRAYEDELIGEE